jgi:hypothetical protein
MIKDSFDISAVMNVDRAEVARINTIDRTGEIKIDISLALVFAGDMRGIIDTIREGFSDEAVVSFAVAEALEMVFNPSDKEMLSC